MDFGHHMHHAFRPFQFAILKDEEAVDGLAVLIPSCVVNSIGEDSSCLLHRCGWLVDLLKKK